MSNRSQNQPLMRGKLISAIVCSMFVRMFLSKTRIPTCTSPLKEKGKGLFLILFITCRGNWEPQTNESTQEDHLGTMFTASVLSGNPWVKLTYFTFHSLSKNAFEVFYCSFSLA